MGTVIVEKEIFANGLTVDVPALEVDTCCAGAGADCLVNEPQRSSTFEAIVLTEATSVLSSVAVSLSEVLGCAGGGGCVGGGAVACGG